MNPDLDTLATRLYVTIDDLLIDHPEWAPERPAVGITPKLTDAELLTLAVLQALLGFTSEARFIRHAHTHLKPWFPYLPARAGYKKRLRRVRRTRHRRLHPHRRQGLPADQLRERTQPGRHHPDPTEPEIGGTPPRRPLPQSVPTDHRVGQPDTETQLDLERHGGRTKPGVCARILQRILALTAAIWHNETTQQPGPARSLTPYDH